MEKPGESTMFCFCFSFPKTVKIKNKAKHPVDYFPSILFHLSGATLSASAEVVGNQPHTGANWQYLCQTEKKIIVLIACYHGYHEDTAVC